jgi:tubulin--tyrosine ligase-like protein 12
LNNVGYYTVFCLRFGSARGIDVRVTDKLNEIIRHAESGVKLAQKYIHRPTLYNKRKFDLRYILLLRSTQPLEIYLYKMFWIRLANKEFSLDSFDDYEKHFTVHILHLHHTI